MRKIALAGALAVAAALAATTPAAASVSPHCEEGGYCLFSGADFTGTKAVLPTTRGCRAVSTLGFTPARSAARGYGDGYALELYSDTSCTTSVATVFGEVPDTNAKSYALIPIPG